MGCGVTSQARANNVNVVEQLSRSVARSWSGALPEAEAAELRELQPCQAHAIMSVRRRCGDEHRKALPFLKARIEDLGFTMRDLEKTLSYIRDRAPVIVHVDLEQHAAALTLDSHYRSMFEMRNTNDNIHARSRMEWEDKLFSKAYQNAQPFDRCKYGVLNVTNDPQGVRRCAPVYGTSYLLLRGVRLRTTFSAEDSADIEASGLATVDMYAHVLARYTDAELSATLEVGTGRRPGVSSGWILAYKEAQVHGEVRLADHVELVMAHPTLQPANQEALEQLAARCNAPLVWMELADEDNVQEAALFGVTGEDGGQLGMDDDEMLRLAMEQSREDEDLRRAIEASTADAGIPLQ